MADGLLCGCRCVGAYGRRETQLRRFVFAAGDETWQVIEKERVKIRAGPTTHAEKLGEHARTHAEMCGRLLYLYDKVIYVYDRVAYGEGAESRAGREGCAMICIGKLAGTSNDAGGGLM